jgi:hypothetical protein
MQKDHISKIIYDGILAPSGENSQPWRFVVENNIIFLFNILERDSTLYNTGQHGSYVSHGALLENMMISATGLGYESEVIYFPNGGFNPIAKVTFSEKDIQVDNLLPFLAKRHTNRNDYTKQQLTEETEHALVQEAGKYNTNSLKIISNEEQKESIIESILAVEKLTYQNKMFHKFFFEHFFSNQSDENQPGGLYIKTLGLSKTELIGVNLTRHWFIASFLRMTGIVDIVLNIRKKHYRNSASFGAVICHGHEPINYIQTGRTMERVWLKATELGINIQPCVGILYLWEGMMKMTNSFFTDKETSLVNEARNKILEVFEAQGETIPMFFRMGYAPLPKVRAFRSEPEIDFLS